jgi:hypothetical protein
MQWSLALAVLLFGASVATSFASDFQPHRSRSPVIANVHSSCMSHQERRGPHSKISERFVLGSGSEPASSAPRNTRSGTSFLSIDSLLRLPPLTTVYGEPLNKAGRRCAPRK